MIVNVNPIVQNVIQIKNGIMKHVNVSLKIIIRAKKIIIGILAIYKRIRYLRSQKGGITYVFSHNYAKIKLIHLILYL